MRKKGFFRVFCFTSLAVIATVVLITLALTVAHDNTGALTGAIIRKELPYVLGILAAVLGASVPVSYAMMEGYVNARVIVEAMRRTQPLTREKLAASLRGLDAFDLGGYWVTYRPGSQAGSKFVDLSIVNASGRVTQ